MKKSLVFALCLMLMCVIALASCGGGNQTDTDNEHQHTFDYSKWSMDETHHWYGASCEHTTLKISVGEHIDEDDNGICDTCSYDYDHEHTFGESWTSEGVNESNHIHYHARTCTHTGIPNKDEGKFVDENKDGVCDVCSWSDASHTHTYQKEWTKEGTTEADHKHYYKLICSHTSIGNKDEGAFVDENKDGVCDTCNWYDESHTHTFSDAWTMVGATESEHKHYHLPSCSHSGIAALDEGTFRDNEKDGVCDTCGWYDESHTHTYNEEKWEQNSTHHGYYPSCSHTGLAWKDYAEHTDADEDMFCDVCNYDLGHVHTFDLESWAKDYAGHWHPATCDHITIRGAEAGEEPHKDDNLDGVCDVCEWFDESHTHTYDTDNWIVEGTNAQSHKHYHGASCEHIGIPHIDEAGLVDENNDGVCDVCEASTCDHTYDESKYIYDIKGHWYKTTCGHNVKGKYTEHIGTEDGACDDCLAFVDFEKLIENSTSASSTNKVVSGLITQLQHGVAADVLSEIEYVFGVDGYLYIKEKVTVIKLDDGTTFVSTTEYWYTLYNDGQSILGMRSEDGGTPVKINEELSVSAVTGYYFPCAFVDYAFGDLGARGVEQLIYKLYDIKNQSGENSALLGGDVICDINPENGMYQIRFVYNGYEVVTEFSVDDENVITEVNIVNYAKINNIEYTIKQYKGERTEKSPFDPNEGLIEEIVIKDANGNVIDPSQTIVIDSGVSYNYYLTITPSDFDPLRDAVMAEWNMDEITSFYYAEELRLFVKGYAKGVTTITLRTTSLTITLTFDTELPKPTTFEPKVHYSDGGFDVLNEVDVYTSIPLGIESSVNSGADSSYKAEIISGEGATLEWDDVDERYVFVSSTNGTYTVRLTSLKDESITAELILNVKDKPNIDVASIINGKYEYDFYGTLVYELEFIPYSENATEGILWFNDLSNAKKHTGVYTYKYLDGTIEVYNSDGTVTPNIIMNLSDLGTLLVTSGTFTNTKPAKTNVKSEDILIGKYNVVDNSGSTVYTVIFVPTAIDGANNGYTIIKAVGENADKGLDGKYGYVCTDGVLSYTNYTNTAAPKVQIPMAISSEMKLTWGDYKLVRTNLDASEAFNMSYYMKTRNISNMEYGYFVTFNFANKTFTIEDYEDTGYAGTFTFTYENGLVTAYGEVDGFKISINVTSGLFFTGVMFSMEEIVDGETVMATSTLLAENYIPPRTVGDGSMEYPFEMNLSMFNGVTFTDGNKVYYTFKPYDNGFLNIKFKEEYGVEFAKLGQELEKYTGSSEYKFFVTTDQTYVICFTDAKGDGSKLDVTANLESKVLGSDSSVPFTLVLDENFVQGCIGEAGDYMWFAYEATSDCKLSITLYRRQCDVKYGTDLDNLTVYDAAPRNTVIEIELNAGEVAYIAIRPTKSTSADIGYNASVTPKE